MNSLVYNIHDTEYKAQHWDLLLFNLYWDELSAAQFHLAWAVHLNLAMLKLWQAVAKFECEADCKVNH